MATKEMTSDILTKAPDQLDPRPFSYLRSTQLLGMLDAGCVRFNGCIDFITIDKMPLIF